MKQFTIIPKSAAREVLRTASSAASASTADGKAEPIPGLKEIHGVKAEGFHRPLAQRRRRRHPRDQEGPGLGSTEATASLPVRPGVDPPRHGPRRLRACLQVRRTSAEALRILSLRHFRLPVTRRCRPPTSRPMEITLYVKDEPGPSSPSDNNGKYPVRKVRLGMSKAKPGALGGMRTAATLSAGPESDDLVAQDQER